MRLGSGINRGGTQYMEPYYADDYFAPQADQYYDSWDDGSDSGGDSFYYDDSGYSDAADGYEYSDEQYAGGEEWGMIPAYDDMENPDTWWQVFGDVGTSFWNQTMDTLPWLASAASFL